MNLFALCYKDNSLDVICNKKFNFFIAIDFGTDGVGISYASSHSTDVWLHQWNSTKFGAMIKQKTIILLDEHGEFTSFGVDAKLLYMTVQSTKRNKWMLFDRFKMALYDNHENDEKKEKEQIDIKDELTATNGNKYPSEKVFIAAFKYLYEETQIWLQKKQIKLKKEEIQWIITVPAIWNFRAKQKMQNWAIRAGLVNEKIKNQCKIVYEPDCASLAIQHYQNKDKNLKSSSTHFEKDNKYILIDAGGGTVDIACHKILDAFGVKEILPPSGGKWGSCYIDDQFIQLLEVIFSKELMNEFKREEPNVYVEMIHNFQVPKSKFYTNPDDEHHNIELPFDFCSFIDEKMENNDDEKHGDIEEKVNNAEIIGMQGLVTLDDQTLEINAIVWKDMFDHVINPTVDHIKKLLNEAKLMRNCKHLCLVGGLSCSPYFQYRVKQEFGLKSKYKLEVVIPNNPILSVVEGAAYFGITKHYIKARILDKTYGLQVNISVHQATKLNIPKDVIEGNLFYNKVAKQYFVKDYFQILAHKNQEIYSNQIITNSIDRKCFNQELMCMTVVCSDLDNPIIATSDMILGKIYVRLGNDDGTTRRLKIEFHFDTMLKVYVYPIGQENKTAAIGFLT